MHDTRPKGKGKEGVPDCWLEQRSPSWNGTRLAESAHYQWLAVRIPQPLGGITLLTRRRSECGTDMLVDSCVYVALSLFVNELGSSTRRRPQVDC